MKVASPVSAEDCIEFVRAMSSLQRALALRLSPLLEQQHGLDLRLFVLLKRIHGGAAHPGALASFSMESPSQITRQLDKLEGLGFIERSLDREDSRRIRLALTGRATALFEGVEGSFAELIGPALSELEPDHRQALLLGLGSLVAALQPEKENGGPIGAGCPPERPRAKPRFRPRVRRAAESIP